MLEAIRNRSNGPIAKFIIGLIIIPFAFAGVYSYFNVNNGSSVATINGEDISIVEFDRAYRAQQQRWGENFDKYFSNDERLQQFRMSVLQQLINQRLSAQAINDMALRISDDKLRTSIMAMTEFHDVDGNFDNTQYEFRIQSSGQSTQQFQYAQKSEMASSQFFNAIQESAFVLKNEIKSNTQLSLQKRDIDYLIIPQEYYAKQVDLTGEEGDSARASYYELNKSLYAIPEKVSVEYVIVSKADPSSITISDGQVAEYYNDNISSYEAEERRRLAHILITIPVDAEQALIDSAENKINTIAVRINAGESFEDLAMELSDDSLSAEMGGDLDWIEKGMMSEEFENVAFAMQQINSVSSVVKSNFGFHIIKLLEIDEGGAQPIEKYKAEIVKNLQEKFVDDKFFDLKDIVSEQAFEVPDTLADAALSASTNVRSTVLFDRQFGIGLPPELRNQPGILEMAFSDDVLFEGLNSEQIELSNGNIAFIRLKEHQQSGTSTLEEVTDRITTTLIAQRAREATESAGAMVVAELFAGKTTMDAKAALPSDIIAVWQQQLGLTRSGTEISTQLRDEVFRVTMSQDGEPSYKGLVLTSGDYAVIKLLAVNMGEESTEFVAGVDATTTVDNTNVDRKQQLSSYQTQSDVYHYLKALDASANISRSISTANLVQ